MIVKFQDRKKSIKYKFSRFGELLIIFKLCVVEESRIGNNKNMLLSSTTQLGYVAAVYIIQREPKELYN